MALLGRLTAGLAHELNNPAMAANQAAGSLQEHVEDIASLVWDPGRLSLTPEKSRSLSSLQSQVLELVRSHPGANILDRSDLEEELHNWMEAHQVLDGWEHGSILAQAGIGVAWLDELIAITGPQAFAEALSRMAAILNLEILAGEIENSTRRLTEIVNAVRSFAYLDQAPQEVDLHMSLENALLILGYKLKSGVKVIRKYEPDLPHVPGYRGELSQVWVNLIDNAIDALDEKGTITIRTSHQDGSVFVEIADDGPGIPPENQGRIFEPFFTTKELGKGTGLGLDISYRIIVERHKGEIRVESRPGETRFQVRLPVNAGRGEAFGAQQQG